eukprot:SM000053S17456  [mRNA]  locus=s53:569182:570367:+ [translate_table: standard]
MGTDNGTKGCYVERKPVAGQRNIENSYRGPLKAPGAVLARHAGLHGAARLLAAAAAEGARPQDSSTSNWDAGHPPVDEHNTQRGVPHTSGGKGGEGQPAERHVPESSTSGLQTGEPPPVDEKNVQRGATPDESGDGGGSGGGGGSSGGQGTAPRKVETPNLDKESTTLDVLKGQQQERTGMDETQRKAEKQAD